MTGGEPGMAIVIAQVVLALGLIIVGAQVFVGAVEHLSTVIGLDPTILALIIAPIATELPEKFNSVLWVRNGKDTLAMGNITGAMVFQSCLPTVLGLLFTTWTFTPDSAIHFASAGVAFVATILIFGGMILRGRLTAWALLIGGPLYLVYIYLALFTDLGALGGAGALIVIGQVRSGDRPERRGYTCARRCVGGASARLSEGGSLVGAGESYPGRGGGDHHRAVGVLPWRLRAAARREHQRDDARLQLRDRRLRGHSRLLERRRGAALRARAGARTTTRIRASARLLMMEVRQSPEELAEITVELLRRDGLREDVYVRPIIYKSSETIGVRLHNLDADITIFGVPFGQYIDTEGGIRAQVSSWRRTDDNAIPARGKITGAYVNGALAKSEAQLNGFDEAIVLTSDGHVSEGSAENLFIVKRGVLITPPVTDNILEGITRARLMEIARDDLGIEVVERSDRPHRALQRRRGLPVRHRGADQPGHRDRPAQHRLRRTSGRGHPEPVADLLRRGARPPAGLPRLADPGLLGGERRDGWFSPATGRAAGWTTMTTTTDDPDRLRWLGRLLEMVPGTISWAILILPLWLSFSYPWLVAYFVLSFDFYWLCRALWFAGAVIIAFGRIRDVLAVDWTERLAGLADPDGPARGPGGPPRRAGHRSASRGARRERARSSDRRASDGACDASWRAAGGRGAAGAAAFGR